MDYEIKPRDSYKVRAKIDKVLDGDITIASSADLVMDEKLPETVFLLIGIAGERMDIIKADADCMPGCKPQLSEPIEGRIMDARVYLSLLRGLIEEESR